MTDTRTPQQRIEQARAVAEAARYRTADRIEVLTFRDTFGPHTVARLLRVLEAVLPLEWCDNVDGHPSCPSCLQFMPCGAETEEDCDGDPNEHGHLDDCKLQVALRAALAGLRRES